MLSDLRLALRPSAKAVSFAALGVFMLVTHLGTSANLYGAPAEETAGSSAQPLDRRIIGLWSAQQTSGSAVRGELRMEIEGSAWRAHIASFAVPVAQDNDELRFRLPEGHGEFRGRFDASAKTIRGHWIQPAGPVSYLPRATGVELIAAGNTRWIGRVTPLDETHHFYLKIQQALDGSLTAVIRNPESNRMGRSVFTVKLSGNEILLIDGARQLRGRFNQDMSDLSLTLGGEAPDTFRRCNDTDAVGFYPRTATRNEFQYQKPETQSDGWTTASLEEVGLAPAPIRDLIQTILEADPTDPRTVPIHSILIARRGRLVLEEYFHGFNRERPHDTRSAGKTLAPLLVGVARYHGAKVEPHTPVADFFPEYHPLAHGDERKARLTVQNLMTMTSGLASDDNDDASPGHEERLQEQQGQPDWYKYTLDLPMLRDPGGTTAIYSSATLNLVGGVAGRAAARWNGEVFSRYVAQPLQFGRYHLNLMPSGDVYTGGGAYLLPRDQLKLGQLYLNGGVWNGIRVLSEDWVRWSTIPHATFARPVIDLDKNHQYGYGWHIHHFTVAGRSYREYAAEGNGGQFIMVLPELEMVVVVNAGAYGSIAWYRWGLEVIPRYLIPAASDLASTR